MNSAGLQAVHSRLQVAEGRDGRVIQQVVGGGAVQGGLQLERMGVGNGQGRLKVVVGGNARHRVQTAGG